MRGGDELPKISPERSPGDIRNPQKDLHGALLSPLPVGKEQRHHPEPPCGEEIMLLPLRSREALPQGAPKGKGCSQGKALKKSGPSPHHLYQQDDPISRNSRYPERTMKKGIPGGGDRKHDELPRIGSGRHDGGLDLKQKHPLQKRVKLPENPLALPDMRAIHEEHL
jgi:hypothetical protein